MTDAQRSGFPRGYFVLREVGFKRRLIQRTADVRQVAGGGLSSFEHF